MAAGSGGIVAPHPEYSGMPQRAWVERERQKSGPACVPTGESKGCQKRVARLAEEGKAGWSET